MIHSSVAFRCPLVHLATASKITINHMGDMFGFKTKRADVIDHWYALVAGVDRVQVDPIDRHSNLALIFHWHPARRNRGRLLPVLKIQ